MASGLRPRRSARRPSPSMSSVEEEKDDAQYDTSSLLPTARSPPRRSNVQSNPASPSSRPPPPPPPPLFHGTSPQQHAPPPPPMMTVQNSQRKVAAETPTRGTSPAAAVAAPQQHPTLASPLPPLQLPALGVTEATTAASNTAADITTITTETQTDSPYKWLLSIQHQSPRYGSTKIPIVVSPDMTALKLQLCIHQIIRDDTAGEHVRDVAGLFRSSDGCFLSLEAILSAPEDSSICTWLVYRPPPRPPRPPRPFWTIEMIVGTSLVALAALWYTNDMVWRAILDTSGRLLEAAVNLPLREFYRYGPPFLGCWEGDSLPTICARITYHGDEVFWTRNMEECQRIFTAKEEATLRVVRPMLYALLLVGGFFALRSLVREHALTRRTPVNRDMMETYQAFNVMARQMKRALQHR